MWKHVLVRLVSHSFEVAWAALFIIVAISLELRHHHLGIGGVTQLPLPLVIAWEWALLLGGACMVAGIVWPRSPTVGYGIERCGLWLVGGVWVSEVVVLLALTNLANRLALAQAAVIIGGCVGRLIYTHWIERNAAQRQEAFHEWNRPSE